MRRNVLDNFYLRLGIVKQQKEEFEYLIK